VYRSQNPLIILDFDGVLVDSVKIKTDAFIELYKDFGENVVNKVRSYHLRNGGISRYEKFRHFHKNYLGIEPNDMILNNLSAKFSDIVAKRVINANEIIGAEEFLNFCLDSSFCCVVNSATPRGEIQKIISKKGWEKYFKKIYGSPASKVENIIKAMQIDNFKNINTFFFGDSTNDLFAADKTSINFIGINFSNKKNKNFSNFNNFEDFMKNSLFDDIFEQYIKNE